MHKSNLYVEGDGYAYRYLFFSIIESYVPE